MSKGPSQMKNVSLNYHSLVCVLTLVWLIIFLYLKYQDQKCENGDWLKLGLRQIV